VQKILYYKLILLSVIIQGCSATVALKKKDTIIKKDAITGITVTQYFPLPSATGKITNTDTNNIKIYYYKDQILYLVEERYLLLKYDVDKPNTILADLQNTAIRHYYFVYTQGDKYGYLSFKDRNLDKVRVPVDSVFQNQWFSKMDVCNKFFEAKFNIKELYEKRNIDSGILHKYFLFEPKEEGNTSGTVYWEFKNELKKFPFSLSTRLDSLYNSKLCKVRIVNYPLYFKEYDYKLDTVKQGYDLEVMRNIDTSKIMQYFNLEKVER